MLFKKLFEFILTNFISTHVSERMNKDSASSPQGGVFVTQVQHVSSFYVVVDTMLTSRQNVSVCSEVGDGSFFLLPGDVGDIDIIRGSTVGQPFILHRPILTFDPTTIKGMVTVDVDGWLKLAPTEMNTNLNVGHNFTNSTIVTNSLSGPIPVYFSVEIQVPMPLPTSTKILATVILASRKGLSRAGKVVNYPEIYSFLVLSTGKSHLLYSVCTGGQCSQPAKLTTKFGLKGNTRKMELGILLVYLKKHLAFLDVEQSAVLGNYNIEDVDLPLWTMTIVAESARARIKSGKHIPLSSEIMNLLSSLVL